MGQGSAAPRKGSLPGSLFDCIVPGAIQNFTMSGSSQQSSAFAAKVSVIRVAVSAAAYIEIGANPTATTSSIYIPAGTTEYFGVTAGHKLAVLQGGSAGICSVVEGAVA